MNNSKTICPLLCSWFIVHDSHSICGDEWKSVTFTDHSSLVLFSFFRISFVTLSVREKETIRVFTLSRCTICSLMFWRGRSFSSLLFSNQIQSVLQCDANNVERKTNKSSSFLYKMYFPSLFSWLNFRSASYSLLSFLFFFLLHLHPLLSSPLLLGCFFIRIHWFIE